MQPRRRWAVVLWTLCIVARGGANDEAREVENTSTHAQVLAQLQLEIGKATETLLGHQPGAIAIDIDIDSVGVVPGTTITALIHQTWKTSVDLPRWVQRSVDSWKRLNPSMRHVLWDDAACDALVAARFPHLLATWRQLDAVQRADFFRYIVIYEYGGVYADADVDCLVPVAKWARAELRDAGASGFALGYGSAGTAVESGAGRGVLPGLITAVEKLASYDIFLNSSRVTYGMQYVQWVMAARPRHPVAAAAIRRVVSNFNDPSFVASGQTLWLTGPSVWTNAVVDVVLAHDPTLRNTRVANALDSCAGTALGDLVVLPKPLLHYKLVMHHFAGTWRRADDAFKHFNATTGALRALEGEYTNDTIQIKPVLQQGASHLRRRMGGRGTAGRTGRQ